MALTKEKLLDFKDKITYYKNRIDPNNLDILVVKLQFNDLNDLIARLEAAEEFVNPNPRCSCGQLCDSCGDAYAKWRKAAGKE